MGFFLINPQLSLSWGLKAWSNPRRSFKYLSLGKAQASNPSFAGVIRSSGEAHIPYEVKHS
jgi:hypothetical protein